MIRKKIAGLLMGAGLLGMVTLSACLKTSNNSTRTTWAYSTIINAYGDSTGAVLNDGASKVDTTPFPLGAWTVYRDVPTTHSYNFTQYKTGTFIAGITAVPFDSLSYHTVILFGKKGAGQMRAFTEDFSGTRADSTNLRFYNLVDSIGDVNVYINTQKVFSNKGYAPTTGFFSTWTTFPSSTNATVQVKKASNDSLVCSATMSLYAANVYQLYIAGYLHGVGKEKVAIYSAGYSTF